MVVKISPEKVQKRELAKVARSKAFKALSLASLKTLTPEQSAHWADLILRARSSADLDNLRAILEGFWK